MFFVLMSLVSSSTVFANAFDNFVGTYNITSSPVVQNFPSTHYCDKYGFSRITGLKIEKNNLGYGQSHMIYFLNSAGWLAHPVMDYDYQDVTVGSYAKTTGSDSEAISEFGSWQTNPNGKSNLKINVQKNVNGFLLKMHEQWSENQNITAECNYEVNLK
jgi:hypothetical protein